jgi:UDP-N-acetylmuramoylalanine--D-glutamate ligase
LKKQRTVILGAGESGVGAAILAQKLGHDVFVSDRGKIKDHYTQLLSAHQLAWEENQHTEALILNADEIVKSPGIPDTAPLIQSIKQQGIAIVSEIEFAGKQTTATKICITGSNGKTTTAHLIYHILKKAGLKVVLAGNVGESFAYKVAKETFDYCVLELSSFQLDDMHVFKAEIAILLNITPDHLDRYNNQFGAYVASKFRITQNQTAQNTFIYCADDTVITDKLNQLKNTATHYAFSIKKKQSKGAYLENEKLTINLTNNPFDMSIHQLALQGKHNLYNSMAAGIAARVLEIKKDLIRESLSDFQNIEHRLEFVAKIHGISFINDSKATNVNSTWYALESIPAPVIWIVGGVDKGNDYSSLEEMVTEKVKAIICLGTDNAKLHAFFDEKVDTILDATSAKEAVDLAYEQGQTGDHVLLSPACASFDLFENYEDRGHQFKAAVRSL